MKEARFLVRGSAAEPYRVHFVLNGRNLSAYCTCPAGQNGQYCKHRFGIMAGVTKAVVSENLSQVAEVAGWIEGTDVGDVWSEVQETEAQLEHVRRRLSALKKDLARRMRD